MTCSAKTILRVDARPSTRSSRKIASSMNPGVFTMAETRSIASPARSGRLTRTFDISQLPLPRNWAMVGGSDGSPALLVRHRCTLALTSSLLGTVGLPPCISFSTNCLELSTRSVPPHRNEPDGSLFNNLLRIEGERAPAVVGQVRFPPFSCSYFVPGPGSGIHGTPQHFVYAGRAVGGILLQPGRYEVVDPL